MSTERERVSMSTARVEHEYSTSFEIETADRRTAVRVDAERWSHTRRYVWDGVAHQKGIAVR